MGLEDTRTDDDTKYRIVVGVGRGGETSEHAVREALAIASRADGVELHCVLAMPARDGVTDYEALRRTMIEEEMWLVEFVRWVADRTIHRPARLDLVFHVRLGDAASVLTQVAFDVSAALVIVGARHRGRVAQFFGNGTAERLLIEARYPLLVARPRDVDGLAHSETPEPRRPGEALSSPREMVLELDDRVDWSAPPRRISGLL